MGHSVGLQRQCVGYAPIGIVGIYAHLEHIARECDSGRRRKAKIPGSIEVSVKVSRGRPISRVHTGIETPFLIGEWTSDHAHAEYVEIAVHIAVSCGASTGL